ncbi:MAG: DUF3857 and transglutaminase domain-containing protein [Acidobacteria bacterium]|nr:DUF3857 and transglutaminase domain-containing protein [Acidobacteriota bacterium]
MNSPRSFRRPRACLALFLVTLFAAPAALALASSDKNWKPVDPAHLALSAPVVERDADAEAIFWEVRVDHDADEGMVLSHYVRIKVFNDRGRESQSKVDILAPKVRSFETKIKDISARTIKPDGTIIELKKEDIFERTIAKTSGIKVKAKTFAMPSVEPGSIIEYRWREVRPGIISLYEEFEFARDIPVQTVKYYIKPVSSPGFTLGMRAQTFQAGMTPFQKEKDGFYSMTLTNIPAFREEPRMPPDHAVRPWMLVYYSEDNKPAAQVWKEYGRELYESHKSSMKVNDDIKRAAAEAIAGATTDEEKLDHLFTYVRSKVRNVFDDGAGFTREQLDKMKANKTPADTLKRGTGNWHDIDMLFAALASASGFEARVAKVTSRNEIFFDPNFADPYFMREGTENIAVRVGDAWRFYDPGTTYVTKGMLRWQEEGQNALVSDGKEPAFVRTPLSGPAKSAEKRTGKFKLREDGTLEGDVRVEYTGHLAHDMKERYDDESPAEREESVREQLKGRLGGVEISGLQVENVTDPTQPFVTKYHIVVPAYAQRTGKRLFLQPAFFQRGVGPTFPTSTRRHEVYFHYPWSEEDRVEIDLPEGFALDNPETPTPINAGALSKYEPKAQVTTDGRTVIYLRKFYFGGSPKGDGGILIFPTGTYTQLKGYFDEMHKQDGHTLSVKQGGAAASGAAPAKP